MYKIVLYIILYKYICLLLLSSIITVAIVIGPSLIPYGKERLKIVARNVSLPSILLSFEIVIVATPVSLPA